MSFDGASEVTAPEEVQMAGKSWLPANPAPLGLAGFGLTTFLLSMINANLVRPMTWRSCSRSRSRTAASPSCSRGCGSSAPATRSARSRSRRTARSGSRSISSSRATSRGSPTAAARCRPRAGLPVGVGDHGRDVLLHVRGPTGSDGAVPPAVDHVHPARDRLVGAPCSRSRAERAARSTPAATSGIATAAVALYIAVRRS